MRVEYERELKLDAPRGYELPSLPGEPLERRVFTSMYYDTPGRTLAASGLTLRRRMENGVGLWQLKIPADGARYELEQPGGPAGPPREIAELVLAHTRRDQLEPVGELRTVRTGLTLADARGEVVVDDVAVMDGRRVITEFTEVEVELRDDSERFDAIVKRLSRAGASRSSGEPKLFRVLGHRDAKEPKDLLRCRYAAQVGAVLASDPGTRLGADPEALHDQRVAVRRLRALLRLARKLDAPAEVEKLRTELEWLGDALGAVRDLDVMVARLGDEIATLDEPDRAAATPALRTLERRRKRARKTLLDVLSSQRYLSLLDRLEDFADELPSAKDSVLERVAAEEFRKLRTAVDEVAVEPDDATLHRLRIRGKRARYAAELVEPIAGPRVRRVVARAKRLQDVLGAHQDAVVTEATLRALQTDDHSPESAIALGRLVERQRQERAAARVKWRAAWRSLERNAGKAWR